MRSYPQLVLILVGIFGGCTDLSQALSDGGGRDGIGDLSTADAATRCPGVPCPGGMLCHLGLCIPDQGPCQDDDHCINDSTCEEGRCLPYGNKTKTSNPGCLLPLQPFKADQLEQPLLSCRWSKGSVLMAPVVADLNGDKVAEILVVNDDNANLVALHSNNCGVYFDVAAGIASRSQVAVADLTGDKIPEIIGVKESNRVVAMSALGAELAVAGDAAKTGPTLFRDGGIAVANLDNKGPPEIVYAGMALRYEGGVLKILYNVAVNGGHWGVISVVADVDLDNKPEVVVGNQILDGMSGKDKTPAPVKGWGPGYPAVADFDPSTPEPEVVLISSTSGSPGTLRVYHPLTGKVLFGPVIFGQGYGGPPTIADFDGDGKPEVGAAGFKGYSVFDPECEATPLPSHCAAKGVRWTKATRDHSSGSTGSMVFDFNGDGKPEVVYRDECWLRIYDGPTGQVRFARSVSSGTILDMPVVADLENDGHADLIVPSTGSPSWCKDEADLQLKPVNTSTQGVLILRDPKNRWMPSRGLWNQHSYHITNINDDLTVPLQEPPNWKSYNNYRQNVQGLGLAKTIPGPDLTGAAVAQVEPGSACDKRWDLRAKICNRGAARALSGVHGTFYLGDPRKGGKPICSAAPTATELKPGDCVTVSCAYLNPPATKIDLWFHADKDSTGAGSTAECKEQNNLLHLPRSSCLGVS